MRIYQPTSISDPNTAENVANKNYIDTKLYLHTQTSLSERWVILHNKDKSSVIVQVHDGDLGEMILPDQILVVDANTVEVVFNEETRGTASLFFP